MENTENTGAMSLFEDERLSYKIHRYSSFSTDYIPDNILVDNPTDQCSRWSADTNNPPQFLTLKLQRPAIVRKIKFGKFEKPHVCNLKKFRIYGGLDDECLGLLFEGGLKNDNIPETFNIRCHTEPNGSELLPVLYIKIVPLHSWGTTFNFSIWYIELHGQDDPMYTSESLKSYNLRREIEIVQHCLKHFRQQGYDAAFHALQEQTQVRLEHPLISELHKCLVVDGDFEKAEQFIAECISEGMMDAYLKRQDYKHTWRMQQTRTSVQPGNRGGHQLVMDTKKRLVYLYGGWNGYQDLSDLWVFDITHNSWSLLCAHSEQCNGPTPRSCHKMVYDPVSANIFMIGRYLDNTIRTIEYIKSDFFLYDTRAHTWLQICDDTSQVGGPQLVYDHQMCIDTEKRTIYVFGGKILTPRSVNNTNSTSEPDYSGLFSYHIATNTWTQLLVDCHHQSAAEPDVLSIKSRVTHCMVFHNTKRKLYIYGGQRGKEDMDDFLTYDVDTQAISVLNKDSRHGGDDSEFINGPSPGYTLRATIDCDRNEIYVFSSLSKLKDRRDIKNIDASNSFWVYALQTQKWSRIYTCRHIAEGTAKVADSNSNMEPCPRYAHQMVYDDEAKLHYLFGGNPGKSTVPQMRLDDFWILMLEKPNRDELLRHWRYLVRKLHYEEIVRVDSYKAMLYLRINIAEVVDQSNSEQLKNFHKLALLLFKPDDGLNNFSVSATPPLGKSAATDLLHKSDSDPANPPCEDFSIESCESSASITSTSGFSSDVVATVSAQSTATTSSKRARPSDETYVLKSHRAFLFNKLVQQMPADVVQPARNLSDFFVL